MKYCINARQPSSVRVNADEVYVNWKDKDILFDLNKENPKGTIILELPTDLDDTEIDFKELQAYKIKIIFALSDFKKVNIIKAYGFQFYWKYPVTTYYELRGLVDIGVCYILLGPPLYFDLPAVYKFKVPIRLVANLAYDNFIPRQDGVKGTYVRPEDVQYYEKYVDTLEFYAESNKQEETLMKIYKEDQHWPGNLNKLIANLKRDVDNRGLPDEFGQARIQCRHNCMRNGTCNFCETSFIFSRQLDKARDEWVNKKQ